MKSKVLEMLLKDVKMRFLPKLIYPNIVSKTWRKTTNEAGQKNMVGRGKNELV